MSDGSLCGALDDYGDSPLNWIKWADEMMGADAEEKSLHPVKFTVT
jgi:hypothetical protein